MPTIPTYAPPAAAPRAYKYYDLIMVAAVVVLVCSNLIGPAKKAQVDLPFFGTVGFGAGVLFFPISYIFGDILTEVYGYSRERRVIWAGFAALTFAAIMAAVVVGLPPAPGWKNQAVYEAAFGNTWRINGASIIAFLCGSFVNSFIMAKMKIMTNGRHLWARVIGSTIGGELVDSLIFYPLAFYGAGMIPNEMLPSLVQSQFVAKTVVEIVMTPVTYAVIAFLKRAEGEDFYDRDTNFTPFKL
jgi:queuosine precursor transporter